MARQFKNRKKGTAKGYPGRDSGPNTGAWEKVLSGMRGLNKYTRSWNSGYDGPGKGTN